MQFRMNYLQSDSEISTALKPIEVIRRDLRNRITHEPDPEVSFKNATE